MITLIGVGHVFDIGGQIREIILGEMPGAVCVELDPSRYYALKNPQARRSMPPTYRLLSTFQKRMAKDFGGELGSEMVAAIDTAQASGIPALLIDADASILFNRLWREMSLKERMLLFFSALTGLFASKRKVQKELDRFSEHESEYLAEFGKEFPTMKKVLIDERNQLMAGRILEAEARYLNIVAVVGDGHVEGISSLLAARQLEIIRLKQLLSGDFPRKGAKVKEGNLEVSFQYDYP
ncbi:MAG TPA: TraB/GumN family protein [Methanomassiliicoccales archaeon]|nr:TraB/GumN family protein [Methanomassiliicoccales archaeon]